MSFFVKRTGYFLGADGIVFGIRYFDGKTFQNDCLSAKRFPSRIEAGKEALKYDAQVEIREN